MKLFRLRILAFVLVIQAIDSETGHVVGRTIGFGFETEEQCQVRLQEILTREESNQRFAYTGACLPAEKLEQFLHGKHHDT